MSIKGSTIRTCQTIKTAKRNYKKEIKVQTRELS